MAFRIGSKGKLRAVQKKLKSKIRQGKNIYRKNMKDQLQQDGTGFAFITIQPGLLRDKMTFQEWTTTCCSGHWTTSQDANSMLGKGTVFAPFLFILYTVDFSINSIQCHPQKFLDDNGIFSLITAQDDSEYRKWTPNFVGWCLQNHHLINAGKTKEFFDFVVASPIFMMQYIGTAVFLQLRG